MNTPELIDTQWDVNELIDLSIKDCRIELIDTQWDVNEIITAQCDTKGKN